MDLPAFHPWLHRLAVLTVLSMLPLVSVGGLVTTWDVGMVDPDWPTPPWYLAWWVATGRTFDRGVGYLAEHGHRLFGWLAGMLVLALAVGLRVFDTRRWLQGCGVALVVAVGIQGVLGGLRVRLVLTELAFIHGCLAHLVIAMASLIAVFTTPRWLAEWPVTDFPSVGARRLSVVAAIATYGQIVLGALVRHFGAIVWLHAIFAIIVFGVVIVAVRRAKPYGTPALTRTGKVMHGLLGTQLLLGTATWITSNGFGPSALTSPTAGQAFLATAHVAVGAVTFATTVVFVAFVYRGFATECSELRSTVGATT